MAGNDKDVLKKIQIDPHDNVKFEGRLDEAQNGTVTIKNPTESIIVTKCKITSPTHITIQPGYAFIKPKEKIIVKISVLPLNNRPRPPTNERLVVLLGVAPANHPKSPLKMWRGSLIPKETRREKIGLKFLALETDKKDEKKADDGCSSDETTPDKQKKEAEKKKRENDKAKGKEETVVDKKEAAFIVPEKKVENKQDVVPDKKKESKYANKDTPLSLPPKDPSEEDDVPPDVKTPEVIPDKQPETKPGSPGSKPT